MSHTKEFLKTKQIEEQKLLLDDNGQPIILYHGTNRTFTEHSEEKNRTILNNNYQGDWFCYSDSEDIAWKYASSARNQNFNKEVFLRETLEYLSKNSPSNVHNKIFELINIMMDNGYSQGFEIFEKEYESKNKKEISEFWKDLREFEKEKGDFDIDKFCEVLEFVEYSKTGIPDSVQDIHNIFNQQINELPTSIVDYLKELGYKDSIPQTKIIKSNIMASKVLKTNDREKATKAKEQGYDLVIYNGEGTVDGEPEYLVANSSQILMQEVVNKHEVVTNIDSASWTVDTMFETIKLNELSNSIRNCLSFDKINLVQFEDLIKHNFDYHSVKNNGDLKQETDKEIVFKALLSEFIKEVEKRTDISNGSIALYRELGLTSIDSLEEQLGKYWAYNESGVGHYDDCDFKHTNKESYNQYVIKADIPLCDVDWMQTFNNYVISEFSESEITVLNKSSPKNIEYKLKSDIEFLKLTQKNESNVSNLSSKRKVTRKM